MYKRGFTLVELIVVVTILAILATIGFVSYSSYLLSARDSNRAAQLTSISSGLELYKTTKSLPFPDERVEVKHGTELLGYQGNAGASVLETIEYEKGGKDPKTGSYFPYVLTKKRNDFQLMAFFEEDTPTQRVTNLDLDSTLEADVFGENLGILTNSSNTPVHEIASFQNTGIDLSDLGSEQYVAYLKNGYALSGSGSDLSVVKVLLENGGESFACKDILEAGVARGDGIYNIVSGAIVFEVYCDMTSDEGGWTLIEGLGDRFGANVAVNMTVPNPDNYSAPEEKLRALLPFIKKPTFKYSLSANSESFAMYAQIDKFDVRVRQNTYGETEKRTTSWIVMNDTDEVQAKYTSNYARLNLKGNGGTFPYGGHMKLYDSQHGPHSWWSYEDGRIEGLYINGGILSVPISSLPTMGGLFNWHQYSANRFELHAAGTNTMNYSSDPALAGQITAGLWVR